MAAVERSGEQRATLLAEACGDDVELRHEVESLLAHDDRITNNFLNPPDTPRIRPTEIMPLIRRPEMPNDLPAPFVEQQEIAGSDSVIGRSRSSGAATSPMDDRPDPLISRRIGEFTISRVIAVGGMGTVYEPEQDRPRRLVALKMMRGYVSSRSALRRFQFEAEILGKLRHPNIAQVYAAGMFGEADREGIHDPAAEGIHGPAGQEGEGRNEIRATGEVENHGPDVAPALPYFAMEYIPDARTITQFADEHGLDTRVRLRLFAKVCDAVHHGHQKGVIHRDLKPGNILVGPDGEPKVIDFGVARATDSDIALTTMHTDAGAIIGTLQYMSPEQCDADPREIDTRSDVYALGVVLYELLTGELPYDASASTIVQAACIIRERAPVPLSRINRRLRGDVETIVLKALDKNREKRYPSAADMGQDIRRHLDGLPIEARPPTRWQRFARQIARHPIAASTAAALLIAVVIIVTATVVSWAASARPFRIDFSEDGSWAHLLNYLGYGIHTWGPYEPHKLNLAEWHVFSTGAGAMRAVVLGFDCNLSGKYQGSLCVFDVDRDIENPIWQRRVESDEIMPRLAAERGYTAEKFGVLHAWIADVLSSVPGDEIVVEFNAGENSQRVIRIYGIRGGLLYEVWHDGTIGHCYWMTDARLLIFSGDDHYWDWDNDAKLTNRDDPYVIFALRPEIGVIERQNYLVEASDEDSWKPVWYLSLKPENAADLVEKQIVLQPPEAPYDPKRHVKCLLRVNETLSADVWWVLDERGVEIPNSRGASVEYQRNQKLHKSDPARLPAPEVFYLGPMSR